MDPQQLDQRFHDAVLAIDMGDQRTLESLIEANPSVAWERLNTPGPWQGTPLGWAEHYVDDKKLDEDKKRYGKIANYLRERIAGRFSNPKSAFENEP